MKGKGSIILVTCTFCKGGENLASEPIIWHIAFVVKFSLLRDVDLQASIHSVISSQGKCAVLIYGLFFTYGFHYRVFV